MAGRQIRPDLLRPIGDHTATATGIDQTLHQLGALGQRQYIDDVLVLIVNGRMLQMGAQFDQCVRMPERLRRRRERNVLANGSAAAGAATDVHRSAVADRLAVCQRRLRVQFRHGSVALAGHRDHRHRMLCRAEGARCIGANAAAATVRHERRGGRRLCGQRCVECELFACVVVAVMVVMMRLVALVVVVMMIVAAGRCASWSGSDVMM